jgi:hypothetical protein
MKIDIIRETWETFVEENKYLLMTHREKWIERRDKTTSFIKEHKRLPSQGDVDKEHKSLATWICNQRINYKSNEKSMSHDGIRELWENFIKENSETFQSKETIWNDNLEDVKSYILQYNKLPSLHHKDAVFRSLGQWICDQKRRYKTYQNIMEKENITSKWKEFNKEYSKLLMSAEDTWDYNLCNVREYIVTHNRLPPAGSKEPHTKRLASFICNQKQNYKNNKSSMKNLNIKAKWEDFTSKYPILFK